MGQGECHVWNTGQDRNTFVKISVVFIVSTWISCRDYSEESSFSMTVAMEEAVGVACLNYAEVIDNMYRMLSSMFLIVIERGGLICAGFCPQIGVYRFLAQIGVFQVRYLWMTSETSK